MLLAIATPVSLIITHATWKRVVLLGILIFVMIAELLNTAIEKLCDRLTLAQRSAH